MTRALLILDKPAEREKAKRWIDQAPPGTRVEYKAPKRSIEQNAMMWACLTELAEQLVWHGKRLGADDWKLVMLDALRRETKEPLRIVPNTDETGFVNLSTSSSDLSKDEMTALIELILAFGAKHGVSFKEHTAANTNDAGASTASEEIGDGAANLAPVSSTLSNHLKDFARKGFRTLSDDIDRAAKTEALDMMVGNYEAMVDNSEIAAEDWPKFQSIVTVFREVLTRKKTVEEGRHVVATDFIGCSVAELERAR